MSVLWRGGVSIELPGAAAIACDAPRASEVAFVGHCDAPVSARSTQLICSAGTLALRPDLAGRPVLTPRSGRPFTLGQLRLELVPSGFAPGAASLLVDGPERVFYAGCQPAEPGGETRHCDTLVLDARAAELPPAPSRQVVLERIARETSGDDPCAVVGTRLALALVAAVLPPERLAASPAFLKKLQPLLAQPLKAAMKPRPGLVWLGERAPPGEARVITTHDLGLHADAARLADIVRETGARTVHVTSASEAGLAALAELGVQALPLGPPRQLALL